MMTKSTFTPRDRAGTTAPSRGIIKLSRHRMFGSKPVPAAEMASIINPYVAICGAMFLAFAPVVIRVALLINASGGMMK